MAKTVRAVKRLFIIYYLITLHIAVLFLLIERLSEGYLSRMEVETDVRPSPSPMASNEPTPEVSPTEQQTANPAKPPIEPVPSSSGLIIPVAGVKADQLVDSFSDARSEGRVHDAIDIPASAGTPVVAAADGRIIKFFDSKAGGTTIYQLSIDEKFIYYYAHLERRADDVHVGDVVKQGKTIAFVGNTGNAGAGNYHLHFSIAAVTDPKRYWEGVYINPYPLLRH